MIFGRHENVFSSSAQSRVELKLQPQTIKKDNQIVVEFMMKTKTINHSLIATG